MANLPETPTYNNFLFPGISGKCINNNQMHSVERRGQYYNGVTLITNDITNVLLHKFVYIYICVDFQ